MASDPERDGSDRRKVLKCMIWAGTGVLWTIEGGVPKSLGLVGEALAKRWVYLPADSVGFNKPANPKVIGTLEEAIGTIGALPAKPSFMIHTGDISHLSKQQEFDDGRA